MYLFFNATAALFYVLLSLLHVHMDQLGGQAHSRTVYCLAWLT